MPLPPLPPPDPFTPELRERAMRALQELLDDLETTLRALRRGLERVPHLTGDWFGLASEAATRRCETLARAMDASSDDVRAAVRAVRSEIP